MQFVIICVIALAALGLVAALASMLTKGGTDEPVHTGHDCSSCSPDIKSECKLGCMMEEKKKREGNKTAIS